MGISAKTTPITIHKTIVCTAPPFENTALPSEICARPVRHAAMPMPVVNPIVRIWMIVEIASVNKPPSNIEPRLPTAAPPPMNKPATMLMMIPPMIPITTAGTMMIQLEESSCHARPNVLPKSSEDCIRTSETKVRATWEFVRKSGLRRLVRRPVQLEILADHDEGGVCDHCFHEHPAEQLAQEREML